jgi:hypothetical protein
MTLDDVAQQILDTGEWTSPHRAFYLVSLEKDSELGFKCIMTGSSRKIVYSHIEFSKTKLDAVYHTLTHLQSMGYFCDMKDRVQIAKEKKLLKKKKR